MVTLRASVTAYQTVILTDSDAEVGGLWAIDNEAIRCMGTAHAPTVAGYPATTDWTWFVQRHIGGTLAASHTNGTTVAEYWPDKPSTSGAGAHTHPESDVVNLPTDLTAKAASAHNHDVAYSTVAHTHATYAAAAHNHDASYAPTHTHPYAGTSHAHLDADIPASIARDAEVAAAYATSGHSHSYEPTGAVSTHAGLADPHPVYLTTAEGAVAYEPLGTVSTHAQAADPHPTYLTSAEGNAAYSVLAHGHAAVFATLANGATAMALGTNTSVKVTPTAIATYTTTVPAAGQERVVLVLTAGASSFTITFGTGFKPTATLVTGTTAARVFAITFLSDGTNLYETARTIAMVA